MTHAFVSASRSGNIVHGRFADGRMRHEKFCFACLSPPDGNKQVWGSRKKRKAENIRFPLHYYRPAKPAAAARSATSVKISARLSAFPAERNCYFFTLCRVSGR